MVNVVKVALALGAAVAVSAEHSYFINGEYDQEGQHRDASCNNNCFSQFFTNKCNSDNPACACTLDDMRSNYFCCMAKNCLPYVVTDAIERVGKDCVAWKKPFSPFDVEAVCGVKILAESTSQDSVPVSTSTLVSTSAPSSTSGASSQSTSASTPSTASSETSANATPASRNATTATTGSSGHSTSSTGAEATSTTAKQGTAGRSMVQGGSALLAFSVVLAAIF
ncbi:hypothetical protein NLG97_g2817 [Lecanicillium saksenae]|uniref:Uncharacterized protein n=1 Tax=Lecanicillium saksenae TaxID=468837 RepID=A0ACC1R3W6_9HYPO|nr:hypothetical protein NLG97_g2817 [Lecanicillium saksenae]